tara:strand:+ start:347 stop:532 length:186 start_codon:yes stop_codon:yes gene_type:complete
MGRLAMIAETWLIQMRRFVVNNVTAVNAIAAHVPAKTAMFRYVPHVLKTAQTVNSVLAVIA